MDTRLQGSGPTIARAMVVNAAQLATYSQAKQTILATGYVQDGILCHFYASMISGLVTTAASMPVDIVKTKWVSPLPSRRMIPPCIWCRFRIQNMRIINGKPEHKGIVDVLSKIVKGEGFFSLWKGFTPYYMRLGQS